MAAAVASFALNNIDDPLNLMIAPPANESLIDKDRRLRREAEAKRISDTIDEQLRQEASRRKKVNEIKLLLLGQSASGKSTLQKQVSHFPLRNLAHQSHLRPFVPRQFRLMYAPATLDLERSSWRPVVYINIIKSLRTILEALEYEYDLNFDKLSHVSGLDSGMPSPNMLREVDDDSDDFNDRIPSSAKGKGRATESDPLDLTPSGVISNSPRRSPTTPIPEGWSQQIVTNRLRLTPLLSMEETLSRKIGTEVKVAPGREEFFVRSGWQGVNHRRRDTVASSVGRSEPPMTASSRRSLDSTTSISVSITSAELVFEQDQKEAVVRQVGSLLVASQEDVQALWQHPAVKSLIKKRRLRLEESST